MATTFREAMKIKCPLCGAEPHKGCTSVAGGFKFGTKLSTTHNERLRAAFQRGLVTRLVINRQ